MEAFLVSSESFVFIVQLAQHVVAGRFLRVCLHNPVGREAYIRLDLLALAAEIDR
jgi:hypothetical protein